MSATAAGLIELNGATIISKIAGGEKGIALSSHGSSSAKQSTIQGNNAVYYIDGNILAVNDGLIDISFADGSVINGDVSSENMSKSKIIFDMNGDTTLTGTANALMGEINFTMNNTSKWEMTGDSKVSNLTMNDTATWNMTGNAQVGELNFNNAGSNIYFAGKDAQDQTAYNTLTFKDLSGTGGTFNMRTDIVARDLLDVKGSVSGNHFVNVQNNGSLATTGNEVFTIIQTTQNDANTYFTLNNKVELGGYVYELKPVEGTENHLALQATKDSGGGEGGEGGEGGPEITQPAQAGVDLFGAQYMMGYTEIQTLMKRMGDLRETGHDGGNLWVRTYSGEFESKSRNRLDAFDMKHYGLQIGADKKFERENTNNMPGSLSVTPMAIWIMTGGGTAALTPTTWELISPIYMTTGYTWMPC